MKNLITGIVAVVLVLIWIVYLLIVRCRGGFDKSSYHKWTELTVSYLTLVAIVIGGIFAYFKYDNYRRESNYQKVITRYLDNNIDIFTYELSSYTMNVVMNLTLITEKDIGSIEKRKATFDSVLKDSEKLRFSLHKLMVFDHMVYQGYMCIINETTATLLLITKEPPDIEAIKTKKRIIENWSRFIIFNLQDIGELLRKNTYDYDTPNIEKIKEKEAYKEIINRFKNFIDLWSSMISARDRFKDYNENNKDLQKTNPEKFKKESEELNNIWTAKTAELYNYVAKHLDERGILTSKAKEEQ